MKKDNTQTKKARRGLYILITAVLTISAFVGGFFVNRLFTFSATPKINSVLEIIDKKSLYKNEMTDDQLAKALADILLVRDEYAHYYTEDEYDTRKRQDSGDFSGTGISFLIDNEGNPIIEKGVYSVMKNSPAFNAGIKSGDVITAGKIENGDFISFINNKELLEFLNGIKENEKVTFKIDREDEFKDRQISLIKSEYTVSYVTYYDNQNTVYFDYENNDQAKQSSFKISAFPDDTALVVLEQFSGNCAKEFEQVMKVFTERNKSKLILDLRNNGGGFLTDLTKIASYLIDSDGKNKLPVAYSKNSEGLVKYTTPKNNFVKDIEKIVVLANQNTASASECLIGAMLYYGKGFSIDNLVLTSFNYERQTYSTYGKGIMQTTFNLASGGALKLTTAQILWPDKTTCINDVGIVQNNRRNCVADKIAITRALEILQAD